MKSSKVLQFPVITFEGVPSGSIDLDSAVFGLPVRRDYLSEVVRWQLARRQAGTHKTLGRSEVHGTTKKMYKQKGTGRARHGSQDVSQFRGGGIVFGPVPRAHDFKLNKGFRALALKTLLSLKVQEENLVILDALPSSLSKTKEVCSLLKARGLSSVLFIDGASEGVVFGRAIRNLHGVDIIPPYGLNVYDGLRHKKIVMTRQAVADVVARFQRGGVVC